MSVKMRRIAVIVVVVIPFHRHVSDKFKGWNYFLKHNMDMSHAYPTGILFLTIFGEVMFQFLKIN